MSLASVTSQQNAAAAASPAAANTAASNATQAGDAALSSLSGNFGDFLGMLMTQLKNQDPTSPMDSNAFTSELVQFSSVEQQINTNNSLTQLIQLTQAGEVMQSSAMVGKQVTVQSSALALQNGKATVNFTTPAAEPVTIVVSDSTGNQVATASMTATSGNNTWNWNGAGSSGGTLPDGSYHVTVNATDAGGTTTSLPFTVTGTATGVQNASTGLTLELGALSVPFSSVTSVGS
jgi:flagellar basal-body rod modification protein FlgD